MKLFGQNLKLFSQKMKKIDENDQPVMVTVVFANTEKKPSEVRQ